MSRKAGRPGKRREAGTQREASPNEDHACRRACVRAHLPRRPLRVLTTVPQARTSGLLGRLLGGSWRLQVWAGGRHTPCCGPCLHARAPSLLPCGLPGCRMT
jgi:hypothetical protein